MPNIEKARHNDAPSTAASPRFHINGEPKAWLPGLTLAAVLQQRGDAPEAVATALNSQFVPRRQREATVLQPGDTLTVFEAITGG